MVSMNVVLLFETREKGWSFIGSNHIFSQHFFKI